MALRATDAVPDPHAPDRPAVTDPDLAARRLGALALVLIGLGLVVSFHVVHIQLPPNAVTLPYEATLRLPVRQVVPEGWALFTRNPREADLLAFVRDDDGGWKAALRAPHAEPRNVFGFARTSRAQGVEISQLARELAEDRWHDCREPVTACLERAPALAVENAIPDPSLCGDVGLVHRPPVPWAWSGSGRRIDMPSTVIRLEVTC